MPKYPLERENRTHKQTIKTTKTQKSKSKKRALASSLTELNFGGCLPRLFVFADFAKGYLKIFQKKLEFFFSQSANISVFLSLLCCRELKLDLDL